jgi:hypothetical protein
MNGQWTGTYTGTNTGTLVADFDDLGTQFAGVVFAYDNDRQFPRTMARVEIPKQKSQLSLKVRLEHMDRGTGNILPKDVFVQRYPNVQIPEEADTEWDLSETKISLTWKTDVGTNGKGELSKSEAHLPSALGAIQEIQSWEKFKAFVRKLEPYQFAFRGHEDCKWRLRTSFHRTGRASLLRFMEQDIPALHRHLSGLTTHRFNLTDALDYAAFLNLAQHHGYPTPILDWTQSPFVAAYFAYRDLRKTSIGPEHKIRILILDSKAWSVSLERAPALMPGYTHMTLIEPLALNNPRAVPQQSISSVTNVDDLETYIALTESRIGRKYLGAIDLPSTERRTVLHELALMGITAGSLFPGLDGACRQLRDRYFDF